MHLSYGEVMRPFLIVFLSSIALMGCENKREDHKKAKVEDYPNITPIWVDPPNDVDMTSFSPYVYESGTYYPSEAYKGNCGASGMPEKLFLRSWIDETYLWYSEVPDVDPSDHLVLSYFDLLKTTAVTESGAPKDQYHFSVNSKDYRNASNGIAVDYGLVLKEGGRVAYSKFGSSAYSYGIQRGWGLMMVDNQFLDEFSSEDLTDIIFYPSSGESHSFTFFKENQYDFGEVGEQVSSYLDRGMEEAANRILRETTFTATLTAKSYESNSVYKGTYETIPATNPKDIKRIAHLVLNDFQGTAEDELRYTIARFIRMNVTDLIVDLRYNGGGRVDIASKLAYMISGKAGETFAFLQYNDKIEDYEYPILSETGGGEPLPTLNLSKVVFIVTEDTASASEMLINGLRGVGVDVAIVGTRTHGKPYGFTGEENCGETYFSIQFESVNAQYEGDYTDGFTTNAASSYYPFSNPIQGCYAYDVLDYNFGQRGDLLFDIARIYAQIGVCAGVIMPRSGAINHPTLMQQDPLKSNAIMLESKYEGD